MVARAAALRTNINIDGRPLPTTKRRRTSSKACAPSENGKGLSKQVGRAERARRARSVKGSSFWNQKVVFVAKSHFALPPPLVPLRGISLQINVQTNGLFL